MNLIPLLDLFEKVKARFRPAAHLRCPPPLPAPVNKPESDKLSKTVVPNAIRTIGPDETGSPVPAGTRSHMVAMGATMKRAHDLPPAVALALEPRVERVLSLTLSEVVDRVPEGYLKPRESFDATRRVLLKAAEVEKGMAVGKPTVAIGTLYQQVPEIFMQSVPASDTAVVQLPFDKIMEELSNLRLRDDQTQEQIVAQYQTPFLQVTVEESKRFGTKMEPVQVTEFPRVRTGVDPATAEAIAAAEPEATATEKFTPSHFGRATPPDLGRNKRSAPPLELPTTPALDKPEPPEPAESQAEPATPEKSAESRIPFSLKPVTPEKRVVVEHVPEGSLPNGTGEPALPRVPASSGPPVPPSAPPPPSPPAPPTRIPFKLSPIPAPKPESTPTVREGVGKLEPAVASTPAPTVTSDESAVTLPLRPILQNLPPMQVTGDISAVPAETTVSFQFTLIAPQLASGKVVVQPKDFQAALPAEYRNLFLADAIEAPVQLSLPDVLANLPGDALRMREDQEVITQDEVFETPFSTKAAEDARRFTTSPTFKAELASDAGLASKGGLASQWGPTSKVEPTEVAPVAPLARETVKKPAEESQVKDEPGLPSKAEAIEVAPVAPLARETSEKPAEEPQIKGEWAELPKVYAAKIELAGAAVSVPIDALAKAAVPRFDAKDAVAKASALPGVRSCGIIFADGLSIAGNIPAEMHVDGLSAMAPTLLKKLEKHMLETQLGALTCLTVYGEKAPMTFFASGNICLTAVHHVAELTAETRRELATITKELSRTYAQPGTAHVDH